MKVRLRVRSRGKSRYCHNQSEQISYIALHDPFHSLVNRAKGNDANTVIIDGRAVMEKRKMVAVNERELLQKAEKTAYGIAEKLKE